MMEMLPAPAPDPFLDTRQIWMIAHQIEAQQSEYERVLATIRPEVGYLQDRQRQLNHLQPEIQSQISNFFHELNGHIQEEGRGLRRRRKTKSLLSLDGYDPDQIWIDVFGQPIWYFHLPPATAGPRAPSTFVPPPEQYEWWGLGSEGLWQAWDLRTEYPRMPLTHRTLECWIQTPHLLATTWWARIQAVRYPSQLAEFRPVGLTEIRVIDRAQFTFSIPPRSELVRLLELYGGTTNFDLLGL